MGKTAMILGASGLVGNEVLKLELKGLTIFQSDDLQKTGRN